MNNNLYQWHAEQMVRHEMREVDRAVEQERLAREADISSESWLARAFRALGHLLHPRKYSRDDSSPEQPIRSSISSKLSQ